MRVGEQSMLGKQPHFLDGGGAVPDDVVQLSIELLQLLGGKFGIGASVNESVIGLCRRFLGGR